MKYIKKYICFKINEGWLSDKLSKSSEGVKNAISEFTKPFYNIAKKVKSEWKDNFDTDSIKSVLIDSLNKSFENLIKAMDKMDNIDDIENVYDDLDQSLAQFNDAIGKEILKLVTESTLIKSYSVYFSINEAQESVMSGLKAAIDNILQSANDILTKSRENYLKAFVQDDLDEPFDTIKENAKKNINKISKDIENEIKSLDVKKIVDEAKAKIETEKSVQNKGKQEYKAGTILLYKKKDGEENVGEVANNQEDVEDGYINMINKDGKETFIINKENIVGEANEDGDVEVTPEDISNNLEDIKGDKKKMNRLNKYIKSELQ